MATYNGEKYIEEQLLSICRQTLKPDEIVISDDGSRDSTLEIVDRVAKSEDAQGIDFVVITDNPRHGYCGNFEWAIQHTTGDIIFLSDQDDVWMPVKVERVCSVFMNYHDVQCVIHNSLMIDKEGNQIPGDFHRIIRLDKLPTDDHNVVHLEREALLERSVCNALANGMVMCLSREFLDTVLPFPKSTGSHDAWIGFCAMCNDCCWYLSEALTMYRLHGENTCGNGVVKAGFLKRAKRVFRRILKCESAILERYYLGEAMMKTIEKKHLTDHIAYETVKRVYDIGVIQVEAFRIGGIKGACKLAKLYCSDMRYRRSGMGDFLYQFFAVLFHNK